MGPGASEINTDAAMVCAHMKDAGHRGVVATLQRLQKYCSWFRMEVHVTEFIKQCLHCMNSKAGEKIPRPLGVHGEDLARLYVSTSCTSKTAVLWARMD